MDEGQADSLTILAIGLNVALLAVFVGWILVASTWATQSLLLPVTAGIGGAVAASIELARTGRRWRQNWRTMDDVVGRQFDQEVESGGRSTAVFFAGYVLVLLAIFALGMKIGLPLAVVAFGRYFVTPRQGWAASLLSGGLVLVFIVVIIEDVLNIPLPGSLFVP